jgi:hypothetical protein
MNEAYNLSKTSGRKRIKDRGISWKEVYRERSDDLKKRFEKIIGPSSYYRWEGHDYTTNGDYFVIVGPAITKDNKKKWFSGVKRYPRDPEKKQFAPSGEYFTNIISALSHARNKWNTPMPQAQPEYGEAVLHNIKIPRHVKGSSDSIIKTSGDEMKTIVTKNYTKVSQGIENERPVKFPAKIKNNVNKGITALNGYHDRVPLAEMFQVLKDNGITPVQEDQTPWQGVLSGSAECGTHEADNQRASIDLRIDDQGMSKPLNSVLLITWCVKIGEGGKERYEVVAYVS